MQKLAKVLAGRLFPTKKGLPQILQPLEINGAEEGT